MAKETYSEKATLLYEFLLLRKNAYEILTGALIETGQSGASSILEKMPINKIADLRVQFLGKLCQIKELLSSEEIKQVQDCVLKTATFEEREELEERDLKNGNPLQLIRDTIPPPDLFYIPRCLSQRPEVNWDMFSRQCPDVFVFKNVIKLELRKFIGPWPRIQWSEEILKQKDTDCRFILLRSEDHWDKLCCMITSPCHLLRFDSSSGHSFVLEASSGVSSILSQFLNRKRRLAFPLESISETEFVRKAVDEDIGIVCFCELPGMGKSMLLASMARQVVAEHLENSIVVFIQLHQLDIQLDCKSDTILEYISTSILAKILLTALVKAHAVNWFLFFDGLDKLKNEDFERSIQFLRNVRNEFPTAKVFVASRPMVRRRLEGEYQAISVDILPFNALNQVHLLTSVWRQNYPAQDLTKFEEYARICLDRLKALGPSDKGIGGVPLQCKMMAEVFADEASYYAESKELCVEHAGSYIKPSLLEIYRRYLQRQIEPSTCKYKCLEGKELTCGVRCRVRSFHVWQAIQLLFPESAKKVAHGVSSFKELSVKDKLRSTLLSQVGNLRNKETLEFSHRTFAEYLVAEYLAENLSHIRISPRESQSKIHQLVLTEMFLLRENVVGYFLNVFAAQKITLEINLSVEFGVATTILSNTDLCNEAIRLCVQQDFRCLLKSLTSAKMRSNQLVRCLQREFRSPNWWILHEILVEAVENCSVPTVRTLVQFYRQHYASRVLKKVLAFKWSSIIDTLCRRADYELALIFVDSLVTLKKQSLLYCCLEGTYNQSDEQVEKRIEIAQLFLSRRGSLIRKPCGTVPGHLFTHWLHPKCFQFLIDNGADILGMFAGDSFLAYASSYMCQAEIYQVCRSFFIGRPIRDLLFVLKQPSLHFRFPFRRVRVLVRVLHLISTKAVSKTGKQFNLIWQAGVEPFEDENTRAELLKVLHHPVVLEEYQESYHDIFVIAVMEGDVEVVDALVNHDNTLLDKRLGHSESTPVLLAVEKEQVAMFKYLVSKGANILSRDLGNHTVLHVAAMTRDCQVFHSVVELVANQWKTKKIEKPTAECAKNLSELFNMKANSFCGTPLHIALEKIGNLAPETLELFLSAGTPNAGPFYTSINTVTDLYKETALTLALDKCRSLEVVKVLVQHGANWSHKTYGERTMVHICAEKGLFEHMKYFVELGCDINALNWNGNNALQDAIWNFKKENSEEICMFLINAGVYKWHKNNEGKSAFDLLARKSRQPEEVLKHLRPRSSQILSEK